MIAKLRKSEYQENEKWLKKHPDLSLGCYARITSDDEISLRIVRISDVVSNTGRYIPGWSEIPYPNFLQSKITIPRFCMDNTDGDIDLPLEWVD